MSRLRTVAAAAVAGGPQVVEVLESLPRLMCNDKLHDLLNGRWWAAVPPSFSVHDQGWSQSLRKYTNLTVPRSFRRQQLGWLIFQKWFCQPILGVCSDQALQRGLVSSCSTAEFALTSSRKYHLQSFGLHSSAETKANSPCVHDACHLSPAMPSTCSSPPARLRSCFHS